MLGLGASAGARRALALGAALAVFAVAGCRARDDAAPEIAIEHRIEPSPPRVGPARVIFTLTGAGGAPVAGAKVKVEGDMTHPGMEPVFADAAETEPGRYAAALQFTMAGDWVITVDATLPDGRTIEKRIDVRGVGDG